MAEQDLASLADERLADWSKRSKQWYGLFYGLGALSVALSITVASRPHFISDDSKTFSDLAWAAAIFQGLSTFLIASRKAAAYRAAWRGLWIARLRYMRTGKTADDGEAIEKAIVNGWATIDGGYFENAENTEGRRKGKAAMRRPGANNPQG